jgi:hypothetical protein
MKIRRKSQKSRPLIKKYGLTSDKLAKMFGYSNGVSLRNSSRYKTFLDGIEELIQEVEKKAV